MSEIESKEVVSRVPLRKSLFIQDQRGCDELTELLGEGWIMDPYLTMVKMEKAFTVWLLKVPPNGDVALASPYVTLPVPVKPNEFDDVLDVVEATHDSVGGLVVKGYKVHQIYQKNVIMVKRKVVQSETKTQ